MNEPEERDVRLAFIVVSVLGIILGILMILASSGCAHCATCEPVIKPYKVEVPVFVYPDIKELPKLELPPWPEEPAEDAPPEVWKRWYADMAATSRERFVLLKERVDLLEGIFNSLKDPKKKEDN